MRCSSLILAILASVTVNALPIPDDGTCVGSSFSPTNCDSPGAQSINVDPNIGLDPTFNLKREAIPEPEPEPIPEPDDGTCVGSSFSPTNCDSPGAQSINVDPNIGLDPTFNLKREAIPEPEPEPIPEPDDGTCVGSSFSPTNCDSPGAQSINVDPNVNVDPTVDTGDLASTITSATDGVANVVTSTTNGVSGIVGSTGLRV